MGLHGIRRRHDAKSILNRAVRSLDEVGLETQGSSIGSAPRQYIAAVQAACDRIEERDQIKAQHGSTVEHVRDGKPLTEVGAKLLGVPWPPAAT